jgi:chemotaxis signal transduction protein
MPAEAIKNEAISESVNQYLTFLLNGEEYGVEILNVQEIKS